MRLNQRGMKWLGAASVIALGVLSGSALAGIANTKHDLSTGSTSSSKSATGTTEICVFCHTPHGSSANTKGPLWNRGASAAVYTSYANPESMDSANLAPSSSSLACLSCHDGTVAMDMIINQPGSGGYTVGGASAGYTWAVASPGIDSTTKMLKAGIVSNLSNDLTNDHPIGIAYCGGFKLGGGCVDGDFFTAALMKNGVASVANGTAATEKWWIDTAGGTAGTREKTDLIMFSRNFTTNSNPGYQPSVECASCHDVHGGAAGTTFLRVANTSSALCLTCHNK